MTCKGLNRLFLLGLFYLCALSPTLALDPLRIDRDISLINLGAYIRYVDGDAVFSIQNPRDETLSIDIERYPTHWPLETFVNITKSPIGPLRLFATDGREIAAAWHSPHFLTIHQPPQTVQTYAFIGGTGPVWHLWMWGDGQRAAYMRNARTLWIVLLVAGLSLCALALGRRMIRRGGRGGRLFALATSLCLTAMALKIDILWPGGASLGTGLRSDDIILTLFVTNAVLFLAVYRAPYIHLSPWRVFWRTGIALASLVVAAGLAVWAVALLRGPVFGFITADLLALFWLMGSFIFAVTVILSPTTMDESRLPA